jgi:hypothetical protein
MTPIQNHEYYTNDTNQYLLIHKCGNSSIRNAFQYPGDVPHPQQGKVRWTVIRDPIERFISGYVYDLDNIGFFDNPYNLEERVEKHIQDANVFEVYEYVNGFMRSTGKISHTIPQVTYIMNQPIDYYVIIKDLDVFLDTHVGHTHKVNESRVRAEDKKIVTNVLKKHSQRLYDIHQIDYYYFARLKELGRIWRWQNGKIF